MRIGAETCEVRAVAAQQSMDELTSDCDHAAAMLLRTHHTVRDGGDISTHVSAAMIARDVAAEQKTEVPIAGVYLSHHCNGRKPGDLGGFTTTQFEHLCRMGIIREATAEDVEAWRMTRQDKHREPDDHSKGPTYRELMRARRAVGLAAKIKNKDIARRHLALDRKAWQN